jgi:hypothetical protein
MNKVTIHENEHYAIKLGPVTEAITTNESITFMGYVAVNKKTEVEEFKSRNLPEAINFAEHSNSYLTNELWKWIKAQGAAQADEQESILTPDLEVLN